VAEDPYLQIAHHLPTEVELGGALITMVEPHVGFERAYNRWYEDDHFYSGAMVGPWVFAGKRWVATRDLLSLRYPADSPVARPVTAGCYISIYWQLAGHHDDATNWGAEAMKTVLYPAGRGFDERTHIYTAFSDYEFGVLRDADSPMRVEVALNHPFAGMVVEVVEPEAGTDRDALIRTLRDEWVPARVAGTPAAVVAAFTPAGLPGGNSGPVPNVSGAYGAGRVVTLLWFLQADPRQCWAAFARHGDEMAGTGGRLVFAAPFVPTIPGTDTYVDLLR
jgi:hypothetical protein